MGSASKGRCLNRRKDVWGGAIGEKGEICLEMQVSSFFNGGFLYK